jgi:signal transduction histidine kinase
MFGFIRRHLSRTVLTISILSIAIVLTAIIYLTVSHQTQDMIKETVSSSEEEAQTITASIKYLMSIGDGRAVQKQLLDISDNTAMDVFICDYNEKIIFSTQTGMIAFAMAHVIPEKAFLEALGKSLKSGEQPARASQENIRGKRYITSIYPIVSSAECHRCHGSDQKVLGSIVVRKDVEKNYLAIANLRNYNILIGIMGICVIALIIFIVLVKLIKQPLATFTDKMKELAMRVKDGDYSMRLDMRQPDEIGELVKSFNHMAEVLQKKNGSLKKAHKELASVNRELEAFAYSVSHDLRAPLRGIEGFSKILIDDYSQHLDEECKHYLSRIRCNTVRMSALIDDILTLSRAGRTEIQKRPVPLDEIVQKVLSDCKDEIDAQGIAVSVRDLPALNCDPSLMQVVFSNLISNAVKFTKAKEIPEIVIGFDNEKKTIWVQDNGIGFDMQYHDKIFGVFQRLHLPEEYDGTGIGLAIVRRIVERHHGKVWAESEPGKGTAFFIKLPLGG